jgi:hypothetical protein
VTRNTKWSEDEKAALRNLRASPQDLTYAGYGQALGAIGRSRGLAHTYWPHTPCRSKEAIRAQLAAMGL